MRFNKISFKNFFSSIIFWKYQIIIMKLSIMILFLFTASVYNYAFTNYSIIDIKTLESYKSQILLFLNTIYYAHQPLNPMYFIFQL